MCLVEKDEDDGDLFANEGHSDEESPFRKTTGLFASDIRFKDEKVCNDMIYDFITLSNCLINKSETCLEIDFL